MCYLIEVGFGECVCFELFGVNVVDDCGDG